MYKGLQRVCIRALKFLDRFPKYWQRSILKAKETSMQHTNAIKTLQVVHSKERRVKIGALSLWTSLNQSSVICVNVSLFLKVAPVFGKLFTWRRRNLEAFTCSIRVVDGASLFNSFLVPLRIGINSANFFWSHV